MGFLRSEIRVVFIGVFFGTAAGLMGCEIEKTSSQDEAIKNSQVQSNKPIELESKTFSSAQSNPEKIVIADVQTPDVSSSNSTSQNTSNGLLLPKKYSQKWSLFCNDRPVHDGCEIEKFSKRAKSFTSLMGFQDDAFPKESHKKNPNLPVVKYEKFVPSKYIFLQRSGAFKNSEYCVNLEKTLSKNTRNLINIAHSGSFSRIQFLDYYFLTYFNFPRLKRLLADSTLPENIIWKNALDIEQSSSGKIDGFQLPNSYQKDVKYQLFDYYKIQGTDYTLYKSKIANSGSAYFANTVYASLGLKDTFPYYSRMELTNNGALIQTPLPSFIIKDFIDERGVYLIAPSDYGSPQAPDKLANISIFYLNTQNSPPLKITPYCTINFIFRPT